MQLKCWIQDNTEGKQVKEKIQEGVKHLWIQEKGGTGGRTVRKKIRALKGRKGKWNIFIKKINQSSKPQKVILHEYSQQHIILCIEQQLSSFMSITKSHAYENKKQKNQ